MKLKLTKLAQAVLDRVNNGELPNDIADEDGELADWLQENSDYDGVDYAMSEGSIKIENFISDKKQIKEIQDAIQKVNEFKELYSLITIEF